MDTKTISAIAVVASLAANVAMMYFGIPAKVSCTIEQGTQAAQAAAAALVR